MSNFRAAVAIEDQREAEASAIGNAMPAPVMEFSKSKIPFLGFMAIAIGSYAGVLLRLTFFYYETTEGAWILYPNIFGSIILGFICEFQLMLSGPSAPLSQRLFYMFIATGFCGSFTSISQWHAESARVFLMQLDTSPGNNRQYYHGGWFVQWTLTLWIGVSVPLTALYVGKAAAQLFRARFNVIEDKIREAMRQQPPTFTNEFRAYFKPRFPQGGVEIVLFLAFLASTATVFVVPYFLGWNHLAYAAILGSGGAYIRYALSALNKRVVLFGLEEKFPMGTLLSNLLGTAGYAMIYTLSKLRVSYHDIMAQSVLFGMSAGFFGCMTTMSTFVLELDRLGLKTKYIYCIMSVLLGQMIFILICGVPVAFFASQAFAASDVPRLDFCHDFENLCGSLLTKINCPGPMRQMNSCGPRGIVDYIGTCSCGSFEAGSDIAELLIDAQVQENVTRSVVTSWAVPEDGGGGEDVTLTFDVCESVENLCSHMLERIQCPSEYITINSCDGGLPAFKGICSCGYFEIPNIRLRKLLFDWMVHVRYDLNDMRSYLTKPTPVDLCHNYFVLCTRALDHIRCPPVWRLIETCPSGNVTDWHPECGCFRQDNVRTPRVTEALMDALMVPYVHGGVVRNNAAWDLCTTFTGLCGQFLDMIGCPAVSRNVWGCNTSVYPAPNASQAFVGACSCGTLVDEGAQRVKEWIIEAALSDELWNLRFFPPFRELYDQAIDSNPYRQLMYPLYPLPRFYV